MRWARSRGQLVEERIVVPVADVRRPDRSAAGTIQSRYADTSRRTLEVLGEKPYTTGDQRSDIGTLPAGKGNGFPVQHIAGVAECGGGELGSSEVDAGDGHGPAKVPRTNSGRKNPLIIELGRRLPRLLARALCCRGSTRQSAAKCRAPARRPRQEH